MKGLSGADPVQNDTQTRDNIRKQVAVSFNHQLVIRE